ncbi:AraC-like DNA-binding protein [Dysgonomonas sp. PFB1-18]|uniref:helix-turn-helix transcriptional regulator n=1 Tax=unclassified Dysgonomonas TaxID=2630389 RepID=UPI002476A499|nr:MULTISPECIES: response regulator transcription factor [unclassified Dysgonomonas]MDL2303055.1 helix-turn-helix transcriptional regulator [Dysgonomonas sp. OttesenSCG-928-D17]MDH6310136.1 AraC-like DNA-binding protein [Dysgonomonas sp. PF1-14]MDH6340198.1 AraC-like DNA-binding protein [Dysgonomonas sp. PF1-16]MDH6381693.1 AraC-like DNA-binding protein [Dysgonomonas sp. PFB1-18]MDH6399052.1 AraC-like DNA-binding protein [Dysgonomonas sp. PF1-23]
MKTTLRTVICLAIAFLYFQCKHNQYIEEDANLSLLDSLNKECLKADAANPTEHLRLARELEKEAFKQKNDYMKGIAYAYIAAHYCSFGMDNNFGMEVYDSTRYYTEKSKEYFIKAERPVEAFRVEMNSLELELFYGKRDGTFVRIFDLIRDCEALDNNEIKADAYLLLGLAYLYSNNPKDALNSFQEGLDIIKKIDSQNPMYWLSKYPPTLYKMVEACDLLGNNDLALAYSDSMKFYIDKYSTKLPEKYPVIQCCIIASDMGKFRAFVNMNKLKEASPYARKLELYTDSIRPMHSLYYSVQVCLAEYYMKNKEYDKALNLINMAVDHYTISSAYENKYNLNEVKILKSDILAAKGEYKEAFTLKSDVLLYTKEANMENVSRQLSEMYTIYNVDKLEKQSLEDKAKVYHSLMLVISMGGICFLMIAITLLIKHNLEKMKKKNEKIVTQYQELDKYRQEIKGLSLSKLRELENEEKEPSIFEKAEILLLSTHCYKDPNISRESLAIQIGTNRQYLTQAIQDNVNMTFNEYINNYRLEYARILLSENMNIPVEKIYTSAGFINKSTFYRLFKQKYDMTPKEFREISCMSHII